MIKTYAILITITALWFLYLLYRTRSKVSRLEQEELEIIDTMAWKHESNLTLIKKTVQKRIRTLEKTVKQQEADIIKERKDNAEEIATLKQQLAESRNNCKLWHFCATAMHSLALPKTFLVVAPDRKTAVTLVNSHYCLEDCELVYTITGLRDKTTRIVTEGCLP